MRWLTVFLIIIGAAISASGQFQFDFTQSYTVPYALNPAFSGVEGCMDIKVATRLKLGDSQFAPRTDIAGVNIDFASLRYADGIRESKVSSSKQGLSVFILQDKFGPYSNLNAAIGYAYHLPLSDKIYMSAGVAADFTSSRLSVSGLVPENANDKLYTRLLNGASARTVADLTLGGTVYGDRFYVGYSVFRVVRKTFDDVKWGAPGTSVQSVQAGFNFPVSIDLQCYGSGILQLKEERLDWSSSTKIRFRDFVWVGGAYRSEGYVSGLAGFYIKNIQINYGYNHPGRKFLSWSSHEISIGISLFRKDTDKIYPFIL